MSSIEVLEAAVDAVCSDIFDGLSDPEVLSVLARLEVVERRLMSVSHNGVAQLVQRGAPIELGGTSHADVISRRLHISKSAARRRIGDAEQLAPRRALTGDVLESQLPNMAEALRRGDIGDEHVRIIRGFFDKLPIVVDTPTREAAEQQLAAMAARFGPEALRIGADQMMALLNPDGEFSDADRARRRGITIGQQGFDGMSAISDLLDPETRAYLDAVFAKLAAPGICNPADQTPLVDGEPAPEAGCTHPGCHVPGYLCQVHHINEWAQGGPTNIDNLTFTCAPHHRLLNHGWTTRKHTDGTTEWIPPPQLLTVAADQLRPVPVAPLL